MANFKRFDPIIDYHKSGHEHFFLGHISSSISACTAAFVSVSGKAWIGRSRPSIIGVCCCTALREPDRYHRPPPLDDVAASIACTRCRLVCLLRPASRCHRPVAKTPTTTTAHRLPAATLPAADNATVSLSSSITIDDPDHPTDVRIDGPPLLQ
ncbi:hypothetical protein ACLOJK_038537 [Asimina triloba]